MPPDDEISLDGVSFDDGTTPSPESVEPEVTLGTEFLTGIPEQDRAIVAKYVKDWDGKVTQRFQSIHDQYKPYKELGELEAIQNAMAFHSGWNQDPEAAFFGILKALAEHHGENFSQYMYEKTGAQIPMSNMEQQQFDPGDPPDERDLLFQQQAEQLQELTAWRDQQMQFQQDQEEQRGLDEVMGAIHNARPDANPQFILSQLAAGAEPEAAIAAWDNLVSGISGRNSQNASRPNPPQVMSGQGGVPSGQVDPAKLNGKDRRALIDQFLAATQQ